MLIYKQREKNKTRQWNSRNIINDNALEFTLACGQHRKAEKNISTTLSLLMALQNSDRVSPRCQISATVYEPFV